MRFDDVRDAVAGIPHMTEKQARQAYDFIVDRQLRQVLELGFAHGTSTCYFAAALDELGGDARVTTVDRKSAMNRQPNISELLATVGLSARVDVVLEDTSYTWALMRMLEERPQPRFDFVYIDGAHLWDVDGFAFLLADRLLRPGGWVLFDDMNWTLASSPSMKTTARVRELPKLQQKTPQVRKVFELLVRTHRDYGEFIDQDGWGWARKLPGRPAAGTAGGGPPAAVPTRSRRRPGRLFRSRAAG